MPMPFAASTASGSTSSTATYAFVRTGGTATMTSATSTGQNPKGRKTSATAITARLGSARPTFEALIARSEPRWRWPSQTPSGTAIASAIAIAAPDRITCSQVFSSSSRRSSTMNSRAPPKTPNAPTICAAITPVSWREPTE